MSNKRDSAAKRLFQLFTKLGYYIAIIFVVSELGLNFWGSLLIDLGIFLAIEVAHYQETDTSDVV